MRPHRTKCVHQAAELPARICSFLPTEKCANHSKPHWSKSKLFSLKGTLAYSYMWDADYDSMVNSTGLLPVLAKPSHTMLYHHLQDWPASKQCLNQRSTGNKQNLAIWKVDILLQNSANASTEVYTAQSITQNKTRLIQWSMCLKSAASLKQFFHPSTLVCKVQLCWPTPSSGSMCSSAVSRGNPRQS